MYNNELGDSVDHESNRSLYIIEGDIDTNYAIPVIQLNQTKQLVQATFKKPVLSKKPFFEIGSLYCRHNDVND